MTGSEKQNITHKGENLSNKTGKPKPQQYPLFITTKALGPYSLSFLVQRVAPSAEILDVF